MRENLKNVTGLSNIGHSPSYKMAHDKVLFSTKKVLIFFFIDF